VNEPTVTTEPEVSTGRRKRKRGRGRIFARRGILWISYCVDGLEKRESAKTQNWDEAEELLNTRIVEREKNLLPPPPKERRKRVADLLDDLERDYAARRCDSAKNLISTLKPVRKVFGHRRASSITKADLTQYILDRREAGYAEGTIFRELRCLRQAFLQQKAIQSPDFPELPKCAVRDVLITPDEQRLLLAAMDDEPYRDATSFHLCTGWRNREVLGLEWKHVREGTIRLVAENSKTDVPRDFSAGRSSCRHHLPPRAAAHSLLPVRVSSAGETSDIRDLAQPLAARSRQGRARYPHWQTL
jgi:integrase